MPSVHKPDHDRAAIRTALEKWDQRRRHEPKAAIAIHPQTDGAAILRRVLSEPITDDDADADTAEAQHRYQRRQRWRDGRREAGLHAPAYRVIARNRP